MKSKKTHSEGKDGERQEADIQKVADRRSNLKKGGGNTREEYSLGLILHSLPVKTASSIPAAAICIPAEWQGGVRICLQADELSNGKPSTSLTSL